jgi:hypothetical protein
MKIESQHNHEASIDIQDIRYLTKSLGRFCEVYSRCVYIEKQEHKEALNLLINIHNKLVMSQYDQLINDPSIITNEEGN